MLNPFFLQGSKSEQDLVQDLINEHLKIYGVDVYYLPRQYATTKKVIEEVIESEFKFAYPIEAYVESYDGYGNQGTILSKFGIQELDDLTLVISKERYETYIAQLIKSIPDGKLTNRPKEGDIIYFPLGNRLFEIKYVEHEKPFYQLKKNYTYQLTCELFRYEDEIIDTGVDFIDDPTEYDGDGTGDDSTGREQYATTISLQLIGIGSTATASAGSIVNGGVRFVSISNRGNGYTSAPRVAFSSAPTSGTTAVGFATMIGGIIDLCEPDSKKLRVQSVELTNPGYGYTIAPKVSFVGGGGGGAAATAYIGNGIVGIITVTNGGSGYLTRPTVTFVGISSVSAAATAYINPSGSVTEIRLTNAGLGYTQVPQIQISSPNIFVGVGTYIYNEIVTGSQSGIEGRVKKWNSNTKILDLSSVNGDFIPGENIVGSASSAIYSLRSININNQNNKFAQNSDIEDLANQILDFSETNPFGMP
ncbi:MAG: hypothetical protein ACO23I_05635 [Candidatus Nanopelagicales bacterium]